MESAGATSGWRAPGGSSAYTSRAGAGPAIGTSVRSGNRCRVRGVIADVDLGILILVVGAIVCVWALRRDDRDPGSGDYSGWEFDGDGDGDD